MSLSPTNNSTLKTTALGSNASYGVYYTHDQVLRLIEEAHIDSDIDLVFILCCSIFIFLMQMGFAMVEAGTVRAKNSSNILLKNLLDTYVGAIVYYLVGYGLANDAKGGIVGNYHFASNGFEEKDYLKWILQYSVCSNIPTIVAGSLAERTFVDTYMFFSLLMTGVVFPVASAWIWGGGWLSVFGFKDFAGAGVVHLLGGVCGLVGTVILGPRLGLYGNTHVNTLSSIEGIQRKKKRRDHTEKVRNQLEMGSSTTDNDQVQKIEEDDCDNEDNMEPDSKMQVEVMKVYLELKHKLRRRSNSQINIVPPEIFSEQKKQMPQLVRQKSNLTPQTLKSRRIKTSPASYRNQHFTVPNRNIIQDSISIISSSHIDRHYSKALKAQQVKQRRLKEVAAASEINILGPLQIARIEKIRKEFPEFAQVEDRQVNKIIELYDVNIKSPIKPASVALIAQGTFFLWICWLFYNTGASQGISFKGKDSQPGRIVMNTIISSSAACVSILFWRPLILSKSDPTNKYPLEAICNSLLVGLVSITGCGDNVQPWAALIIGLLGTLVYCLACKLYAKLKIDDPLEASQIHAFCGFWGLLSVGFFDKDLGILYTGNFNLLLKQFVGAFAIIAWAFVTSFLYFYCLKKLNKFRIGYIYEIIGMDVLMHGLQNYSQAV